MKLYQRRFWIPILTGTVWAVAANCVWAGAPVLPKELSEDSWTSALATAIKADDYREPTVTSPTLYKELEVVVPKELRPKMGMPANSEEKRFVPMSMLLAGPMGRQPKGVLSGKIVYSNAGHGWTQDESKGVWYTQRPLLFDMVEDMGNGDQLSLFAEYCWRVGATFVPLRPVGHQVCERILDNADRHVKWQGAWFDAPTTGSLFFGPAESAVAYRYAVATKDEASVVRFRPVIGVEGIYPVYVWARDGADRVPQTYRVMHRGGATQVTVDHRRVGKGWVWLGSFPFSKGEDGYVEIASRVEDESLADGQHVVVADAVRFGNGLGDLNRGNGISGYPREEEASLYWIERMLPENGFAVQFAQGRDEGSSNVGAPPRTGAFMNRETGGGFWDRIYLGWHSNALDRQVNPNGRGASGLFCQSPALRPDFQEEYGRECARVINDLLSSQTALGRALPVPYEEYTTGTFSQIDFGEIRRDYLANEMPATIVEVAFHDDPADARLLRSPFVRHLFARAMVQVMTNLFAAHNALEGNKDTLPPGAPDLLAATTTPDGKARVTFRPAAKDEAMKPSNNTAFKLYCSYDGIGFDGGRMFAVSQLKSSPLAAGAYEIATGESVSKEPRFFKISAVNPGGESRASWVLGTFEGKTTETRVRIASVLPEPSRMETFDDLTLTQTVAMNLHAPLEAGGDISRFAPELTQTGAELIAPAQALAALKIGFDTAALREKTLFNASVYAGTVVSTGRRANVEPTDIIPEPTFVSGSATRDDVLMSESAFLTDIATSVPLTARLFSERYGKTLWGDARNVVLDDGARAKVLMTYGDAPSHPALVTANGEVTAGFPFEAVVGSDARKAVMARALVAMNLMDAASLEANTSAPKSAVTRAAKSRVPLKNRPVSAVKRSTAKRSAKSPAQLLEAKSSAKVKPTAAVQPSKPAPSDSGKSRSKTPQKSKNPAKRKTSGKK